MKHFTMESFPYSYNGQEFMVHPRGTYYDSDSTTYTIEFDYKNVRVRWSFDKDNDSYGYGWIKILCKLVDEHGEKGLRRLRDLHNIIQSIEFNSIQ